MRQVPFFSQVHSSSSHCIVCCGALSPVCCGDLSLFTAGFGTVFDAVFDGILFLEADPTDGDCETLRPLGRERVAD